MVDKPFYYNRQGEPIDQQEMARLYSEPGSRQVARTQIGDILVSTVHLVIDHAMWEDGPPVIFETMIFNGEQDGRQRRYCTEAEALAGHDEMVATVTRAQGVTLEEIELELAGL